MRNRAARWVERLGTVSIGLGLCAVFAAAAAGIDGLVLESYDPQMVYLLDSLAPFRGHLYAFIDHPGTPVEVIGTVLLALTAPFVVPRAPDFVAHHIAHPEIFLVLSYAFLTAGSIATVVLIVRTFGRDLEPEPAATLVPLALAALYFASLPRFSFLSLVFWSHNSFSFVGGASLLGLLFASARSDRERARRRLLVVGILVGFLTAVQLYFAAWVVGAAVVSAVLARSARAPIPACLAEAARIGLASAGGFLAATVPILPRYPEFLGWVLRLVRHTEKYGRGEEAFVSADLVLGGAMDLWRTQPVAVGSVAGSAVLLVAVMVARSRRGAPGWWWALGFGVLAQLTTLVLLILKHPSPRYLPSAAAVVPFVLGLALPWVARGGRWRNALVSVASVIVLASFFSGVAREVDRIRRTSARARNASAVVQARLAEHAAATGRPRRELVVLWGYGSPSTCFGRRMGAAFHAEEVFDADVDRLCPNEWNLDAGRREVSFYERVREGSIDWDVIVFRPGTPQRPAAAAELGTATQLKGLGGRRLLLVFRDEGRAPRPAP